MMEAFSSSQINDEDNPAEFKIDEDEDEIDTNTNTNNTNTTANDTIKPVEEAFSSSLHVDEDIHPPVMIDEQDTTTTTNNTINNTNNKKEQVEVDEEDERDTTPITTTTTTINNINDDNNNKKKKEKKHVEVDEVDERDEQQQQEEQQPPSPPPSQQQQQQQPAPSSPSPSPLDEDDEPKKQPKPQVKQQPAPQQQQAPSPLEEISLSSPADQQPKQQQQQQQQQQTQQVQQQQQQSQQPSQANKQQQPAPSSSSPSSSSSSSSSTTTTTTKSATATSTTATTGKPANWVPDESSNTCTTCKTPFTFLNRRHHCRRCGGLFCNDCCGLNTSLPEQYGQKKRSRVCNKCFKVTVKERLQKPDFTTIADGGPSTETKLVSSMLKVLYWKMGAHEGGLFDRTVVDVGETSAGAISVQQMQDLMTDTEVNPVRIRVYTPTHKWKGSDKRAILVWFHTGHFCTRSIESPSVDGLARLLANQVPVTIISVDYRLAPDHVFPAAVDDGYEAVLWAIKNSVSMGSHPSLISVGGDGAGGNIAAAVALMARDKGLPGGVKLLSQLLVTPPLNLTDNPTGPEYASREANKNAYMLPLSQFTWFAQQYAKTADKTSPYLSPILASDLSNLPPALVIGAGLDLFHSEAKAYANKMRTAGVRVVHTLYSNSANGFFGSGLDESDEAVMELVLFLSNEIIAQMKKL